MNKDMATGGVLAKTLMANTLTTGERNLRSSAIKKVSSNLTQSPKKVKRWKN